MTCNRRALLRAASLAPLAFGSRLAAQPAAPVPPIVLVHGNGDSAALWLTTLWRFEQNGVAPDRIVALNLPDPLARTDDSKDQAGRSSTEDQRRAFAEAVAALRARTGADRVAAIANSRGGYAIRSYVRGGGRDVGHAVLCGVPNHGVYDWDESPGSEFNGRGPFLSRLNGADPEADAGTAWLTLRSDGQDKYAQADGRFAGRPGKPTGITNDGPALTGATNLLVGQLDHREVAFHPRAFREMYRFLAGREPDRIAIVPEPRVTLDGLVTGLPGGVPTNRPLPGARLEIHRVDPETGGRIGEALRAVTVGADGRWGPVSVEPGWFLEFVLAAEGHPTAHVYRSPFPRSSNVVHLRPPRAFGPADAGAGAIVTMSRPRGYLGIPRDIVLIDGAQPRDVVHGVPTDAAATVRLPASEAGRPVVAIFNEERIVARSWPASENRVAVAEFTF